MANNLYGHKILIKNYLEYISKQIDSRSSKYNNFLLIDTLNSEPTEESMKSFCQINNLKNLLDELICYKSSTSPSCVSVIITKKSPVDFKTLARSRKGSPTSTK